MHVYPAPLLKGCLVLVTVDGENFRRTRIAEVTPSGRYVRLESDEPTPGGIQRWRTLASLQLLETHLPSTSIPVMHGILHLQNPSRPGSPSGAHPWFHAVCAEAAPNVIPFPLSACSKADPACPPAHEAHGL